MVKCHTGLKIFLLSTHNLATKEQKEGLTLAHHTIDPEVETADRVIIMILIEIVNQTIVMTLINGQTIKGKVIHHTIISEEIHRVVSCRRNSSNDNNSYVYVD